MGASREHKSTMSMPEARVGDRHVRAEDIPAERAQWPRGSLRCVDCAARLIAVDGSPRENAPPRRPYFRRMAGQSHGPDCIYNIEERIRVIRLAGDGVVELEKAGEEPRYRLVVPEALEPGQPRIYVGSGVLVVAEQLGILLNTTVMIAALVEEYEARGADPHIEWSATCGGRRVEWRDFVYVPQRIWALRRLLEERGGTLRHPVAVIFRPRVAGIEMGRDTSCGGESTDGNRLAGYRDLTDTGAEVEGELVVDGRFDLVERAFAAGIDSYYIGYGGWELAAGGEVTLHLQHHHQIAPVTWAR